MTSSENPAKPCDRVFALSEWSRQYFPGNLSCQLISERENQVKPWTYAVEKDGAHMVNEALFRAAARAPLFEAKTVGKVAFAHEEFMKIALEDSDTDGQA